MIIVDTGAFVGLFNRRDAFRNSARAAFASFQEPFITTYPVLSETCYLLFRSVGHIAQANFLRSISRGAVTVFEPEISYLDRMIDLMETYADLPMDFADASLVVLAEYLGHGRILTVDQRDFSVYRWSNTNPFENLLR
jgi:uncharacterized protein